MWASIYYKEVPMIAICLEHLERAIDEYLVQYEQAPDILNLAQAKARGLDIPATCQYCGERPSYVLTKIIAEANN